jgi:hypothetical protein
MNTTQVLQCYLATNLKWIASDSPQTMGYTGTDLTTITLVDLLGNGTYVKTMTYTLGVLQTVSGWVKQ